MKFKLEQTQNNWKQQTGPSENSEVKGGRRLVLRHEDSVGYSPWELWPVYMGSWIPPQHSAHPHKERQKRTQRGGKVSDRQWRFDIWIRERNPNQGNGRNTKSFLQLGNVYTWTHCLPENMNIQWWTLKHVLFRSLTFTENKRYLLKCLSNRTSDLYKKRKLDPH